MADGMVELERREHYIGEKQNLLRDGYGTYVYENQFFRYEGEWMKGKKHGHGKLIMKDGTYYEGQFTNGEINGSGYKYFAFSQSKYTGQFLNGEMTGLGCMIYKNGSVYDGQWYRNKRQGFGIFSTRKRCYDEEVFQLSTFEGEGSQPYDYVYHSLSNGDRYEGDWVMDKRQGNGQLFCSDGTLYRGQFMNDFFHGEGNMIHASGIYYKGMWVNGYPAVMATKIVLLVEESPLVLYQGQSFSITVECRNDEDELVPDTGRELQVTAGFRYWEPKQGSALFDVIEDFEEKIIETPYYSVVPYPLTNKVLEVYDGQKISVAQLASPEENTEEGDEKTSEEKGKEFDEHVVRESHASDESAAKTLPHIQTTWENNDAGTIKDVLDYLKDDVPDDAVSIKSDDVTHMFPVVSNKPTASGVCAWMNLQLAPPPPMYRPFVIRDSETQVKKRSKESTAFNEEFEVINEENESDDEKKDEEMEEFLIENMLVKEEEAKEIINEAEDEIENNFEEKKQMSLLSTTHSRLTLKSVKLRAQEEKFARPGEYILIVQEVTNPPFMGRTLESAYLVIELKEAQNVIVKKTNSKDLEEEQEDEDGEDDFSNK